MRHVEMSAAAFIAMISYPVLLLHLTLIPRSLCSWHHLHSLQLFCVMLRKLQQQLQIDLCGKQNIDALKH